MECTQLRRIKALENDTLLIRNELSHLVQRLDSLTKILTTIAVMFGGSMLAAFGFLVRFWVMGG
jgi:hypothetical protein